MASAIDIIKKPYRLFRSVPARVAGTITHVVTKSPVAALTFDDGPDPAFTPPLLEILEKYNAKATFFMVGKMAEKHPDLVVRVARAGHAIGVHSWNHPSFPSIPGRERRRQIRACERAVAPYGSKLFRPPYGHQTTASFMDTLLLGYRVITWSMHAFDWELRGSLWMANKLRETGPGSIVLLHDSLFEVLVKGAGDRTPMLEALEMFLDWNDGRLSFVTIPELLDLGIPVKRSWRVRNHHDWK